MSDYSNKELLEAVYEVRDRVTRIEEKLNRAEKVEEKVEVVSEKALEAKDIAEDALALAQKNREDILAIQANAKWAWGFVITFAASVVGAYFGLK